MAEIVASFICPHAPPMFTAPAAAGEGVRARVDGAYGSIRNRIAELEIDTVIVVGSDHYVLFGPGCLPPILLGVGEVFGPTDRLPGIEQGPIPSHPALARHLLDFGAEAGFDIAAAKSLGVDHGIGIPVRLCTTDQRIIPLYIASGVDPMIRKSRAFELGAMVRNAVAAWPGDERVAVIGSGGISHTVGMPGMGRVNPEFDTWVLDRFVERDAAALITLTDEDIVEQAGNGALEIRNFLVAMGAAPPRGPTAVLAYEAAPAWFTGLGFAEALA